MRRCNTVGLAAFAVLGLGACALEPGAPWGEVAVTLEVGLAGGAGRFDPEGRVRTDRDFRVAVTRLDFEVVGVELLSGVGAAVNFDPANPPAGYGNCHNGHCHADDGRLVDYADIAAELAGGASASVPLGRLAGATANLAGEGLAQVALGPCEGDASFDGLNDAQACMLGEPATLAVARVTLAGLSVSGRFFDSLSGNAARLPPEGVPFTATLTGDADAIAWVGSLPVEAVFGPGEPAQRRVGLQLVLDASAFDGVDAGALADEPEALAAAIADGLERELALE